MPIYDWFCKKCEREEKDVFYQTSKLPKTRACKCGGKMVQDFSQKGRNQIHHDHSSLYGKWEPSVGEYIYNYSHKQQIMKKYNITEANDPVGGSREFRTDPPKNTPNVTSDWTDEPSNAQQ